jgi:hypothetical protein
MARADQSQPGAGGAEHDDLSRTRQHNDLSRSIDTPGAHRHTHAVAHCHDDTTQETLIGSAERRSCDAGP